MTKTSLRKNKKYEIGNKVWICGIHRDGSKTQGTIVHKFKLDHISEELFVVEIATEVDPIWEVREWGSVADSEDGFLNFFLH